MGDISPKGLDFIKHKEGYFGKAYLCPAGVWTIGWGSTRWSATQPVRKGDTCTVEQAEKLLLKEIQRVEDAIDATVAVPLTQGQYDALVSLFYNIGIGWLTGQGHPQATLVKLLNKGQFDKIPSEILKFKMANGKLLAGLLQRRQEEVRELWFGDNEQPARVIETDPAVDPMPQAAAPEKPSVIQAAKESWTVRLGVGGIASWIGKTALDGYEWAFGIAKEAGPEIMALKTAIGPFDPLLKATPALLSLLIVAALGGVIIRRLQTR